MELIKFYCEDTCVSSINGLSYGDSFLEYFLVVKTYVTRTRRYGRSTGVNMIRHRSQYGIQVGYANRHSDTAVKTEEKNQREKKENMLLVHILLIQVKDQFGKMSS